MINLSEAWKNAYEEYLEEEYEAVGKELDSIMEDMSAAQNEAKRSFDLIEQFIALQGYSTILTEDDDDIPGGSGTFQAGTTATSRSGTVVPQGEVKMDLPSLVSALSKLNNTDDTSTDYKPVANVKIERIGDMKFPNNLIFFLKQLALWIRNVVIFFINKILNAIRVIIGKPIKELDPSSLKVNFSKASKIAVTSAELRPGRNEYDKIDKFLTVVNVDSLKNKEGALQEEASLLDILGLETKGPTTKNPDEKGKEKIVVINVQKDLEDLRLLIEHFYNIFDSAYGTNNEYLFGTEDLSMIFNLFKVTLAKLTSGEIPNVALIGNHATEVEAISPDVVRNNLRITSVNMDSLKEAYAATASKIRMILQMIQSKEMMMLTNFGVPIQTLSAGTMGTIQVIASEIPDRQREVKKVAKKLERMRAMYTDLTKKIGKLQSSVVSLGTVQYSTIYNKRLQELFMASKDMTDIVTLRLTGVSLYCKELKDIQDILKALLRLNKYGK